MGDISANFYKRERICKCSACTRESKPYEVERPELLVRLELVRSIYGAPIVINSWCRCPSHNAAVGGVDSSAHVAGWAVDIRCNAGSTKYNLLDALKGAGFNRFGIAKTFIHVDMDATKVSRVLWIY